MILLAVILYLWLFWYAYIIVMGMYRAQLQGRLKGVVFALALPAVIIGYAMDIITQYTLATLIFLDLPESNEHLVTDRLNRYIADGTGWRATVANWVCTHLLDVFDPSGNHC